MELIQLSLMILRLAITIGQNSLISRSPKL
nr:MAG TPA: hypothetical protein [Crassvirales sp.]